MSRARRPVLVLLNGIPGSGKSTLARTWCERQAAGLPLALDLDVLRSMLGGWREAGDAAGLAARELALAAIRTHLERGHDVVVPQLLLRPAFVDALEEAAAASGAAFLHAALGMDPEVAAVRLRGRDPRGVEGALERPLEVLQVELERFLATRSDVVVVRGPQDLDRAVGAARAADPQAR